VTVTGSAPSAAANPPYAVLRDVLLVMTIGRACLPGIVALSLTWDEIDEWERQGFVERFEDWDYTGGERRVRFGRTKVPYQDDAGTVARYRVAWSAQMGRPPAGADLVFLSETGEQMWSRECGTVMHRLAEFASEIELPQMLQVEVPAVLASAVVTIFGSWDWSMHQSPNQQYGGLRDY
jgi:hypothetical protein